VTAAPWRDRADVAADPEGGVLLVGEDTPGALLSSLRPGLETTAQVTVMNPLESSRDLVGSTGVVAAMRRRVASRSSGARLVEAVEQLKPEHVVLIKGRGIAAGDIAAIRRLGARVTCYYPDNPAWRSGDPNATERLLACDVAVLWSQRQATLLRSSTTPTRTIVEVLPFGFDPAWFPLVSATGEGPETQTTQPERAGIAFLGTWSPRRERYLSALAGLPLTIAGTGWSERSTLKGSKPIVEHRAGEVLSRAAIGINLLHPQCAEAHNMRTREIAASGAIEITDPGLDGTPLRDNESCLWFRNPAELRARVEEAIADPRGAAEVAHKGQALIAGDTYKERGKALAALAGVA